MMDVDSDNRVCFQTQPNFQRGKGRHSDNKSKVIKQDPMVPHNMKGKDIIRAQDFNYLMVLGKGSFGKVRKINCKTWKEG